MLVAAMTLMIASGAAGDGLSAAERRILERTLVCPERLKDDPARIRNTERFIARYAGYAPFSRSGTRMRLRDAILAKKKCRRSGQQLGYSFPET